MKKTSIFLSMMAASVMAIAQSPRLCLYEEFTGENCAPCAATNPGLQTILNANTANAVAIKWQVPIPSAPTPTWSLYKTNITEIDWRWKATPNYNYPSQNTPTTAVTNGINSAPSGRIDGQHQWTFGAASDHPANLTGANLTTAKAVPSPFTVTMARAWNPTYTALTVTVNITATQSFTAVGALVFRLVMVEQEIHFATAPGTNGEKDFYNAVRASFPTLQTGTAMAGTWVVGQNQTFTVNCTLPSYIVDKSMVNMVGFIQDDGNKKVMQAAKTNTVGLNNDAAATAINAAVFTCGTSYSPTVVLKNNGVNTITNMTITPAVDGTAGAPFFYAGNLLAGASTTITAPVVTAASGSHTYSVNVTGVSGGVDYNLANNGKSTNFILISSYAPTPITEAFPTATFPPTNWFMVNADGGAATWSWSGTVGGFGTGLGSAKYDFYNNAVIGDADDLFLPPANFTGATNPQLTFDVAYAQYAAENDNLQVRVSTNCGATWTTVYSKSGTTLMTAPPVTTAFSPTAAQWRTETVSLAAFANMPQVLVKFMATSAYGNNMYIDNVNLTSPLGVKANVNNVSLVELFPNPAQTEANVKVSLAQASDVTITLVNALGQTVNTKMHSLNSGDNTVSLDIKGLADGVYSVLVDTKNGSVVKKLTVSK